MKSTSILSFAEALDVEFSMDWDGEVFIEYPEHVDVERLRSYLKEHGSALAVMFSDRESRKQQVLVGGPFANKPNWRWSPAGTFIVLRVKRAKWAVYRQHGDGRAFFMGLATSEKKAKRGLIQVERLE